MEIPQTKSFVNEKCEEMKSQDDLDTTKSNVEWITRCAWGNEENYAKCISIIRCAHK